MPKEIDEEGLDGLPEFQETTDPPGPLARMTGSAVPSTQVNEVPPTTPTRPPSAGAGETGPEKRATTSSPGSSKPDPELEQALEQFGSGVAHLAGMVANKAHCRRIRALDEKWIMLEDEASTIGGALARIAGRQVPSELTEGDGGDLLVIGSVALGYTMRNLVGVSQEDIARFERGEMPIEARAQAPAEQPLPADPHSPPAAGADVEQPATQASSIIAQL
jgi:hypothetical protein